MIRFFTTAAAIGSAFALAACSDPTGFRDTVETTTIVKPGNTSTVYEQPLWNRTSVVQQPVIQQPIIQPVVQQPIVQPVLQQPVVQQSVLQQPFVQQQQLLQQLVVPQQPQLPTVQLPTRTLQLPTQYIRGGNIPNMIDGAAVNAQLPALWNVGKDANLQARRVGNAGLVIYSSMIEDSVAVAQASTSCGQIGKRAQTKLNQSPTSGVKRIDFTCQ